MKKYILCVILICLAAPILQAQTFSDDNFVYTIAPKKPVKPENIKTLTKSEMIQNVTYYDGLGRPLQTIAIGQGGNGEDIITPIQYDSIGRQVKEYLPYANSNIGTNYLRVDPLAAITATIAHYNKAKYENTTNPFSEKKLEGSALSRVLKQAAPGASWAMDQGHEIKFDYQTNTAAEVKQYKASAVWDPAIGLYKTTFLNAGNYAASELYKNVTYDENTTATPTENAGSTVEFKDKEGKVVLKRTYESGVKHDTYYVYDPFGNLTYVIPPKATDLIGSDIAEANVESKAVLTPSSPALHLTATNSIRLLTGFHAQPGSTFSALVGSDNQDVLNNLCYQYKYDDRNRLVEKKLPGKQWEFIVYDKLDRPVATGPALSPFTDISTSGWLITKYDAFGRPVYTGWNNTSATAATRKTLQDAQNAATVLFESKQTSGTIDGVSVNYSNAVEPKTFKLLSVTYYDNYVYPDAPVVPITIEGQTVLTNVKTLATGSWTRVPTTALAILAEVNTTFYDQKARPIQSYLLNHLRGSTTADSKLDFTGKPIYTLTKHIRALGGTSYTIREDFTYTTQDRLLTHTHKINTNTAELLTENTYDALGQLISKKVGNSIAAPLQKIDYNYNVRGWLTEINKTANLQQSTDPKDLFAFKLNYNSVGTGIPDVNALYNGNIAETFWKTNSDNVERAYGYRYDKLNRLKNAIYEKNGITTNAYNESLSYDKNGNIISLVRNGDSDAQPQPTPIDNLGYFYPINSNQLSKVDDASNNISGFNDVNKTGNDYTYDLYGNMITDKNKNITAITYNQLNLPSKITFGTTGNISYFYNTAGQKVQKIVTETGKPTITTDYLGGYQYENTVLKFFPTAEGYVKNTTGALSYVFQYKDHLGNTRLSYAKNNITNVLEIIEEDNYYPFGLKHKGYNTVAFSTNKYKFNGKEFQDELGLNMTAMDFRQYDNALGRFFGIDRLAEFAPSITPYRFGFDNPIMYTDPTGLFETRKEARAYRREHNIRGSINRNDDGSFAINDKKNHISYTKGEEGSNEKFSNDGVQESVLASSNTMSTIGQVNAFAGYGATGIEQINGSFRITNGVYNGSQLSLRYYQSAWTGGSRASITTYNFGKIGKGLGRVGFGIGLASDTYGVVEWTKNSKSPNAVHPAKASLNTGMGVWGLMGGPPGAIASAVYTGIDVFYPGGFEGAANTVKRTEDQEIKMTGHSLLNGSALKF